MTKWESLANNNNNKTKHFNKQNLAEKNTGNMHGFRKDWPSPINSFTHTSTHTYIECNLNVQSTSICKYFRWPMVFFEGKVTFFGGERWWVVMVIDGRDGRLIVGVFYNEQILWPLSLLSLLLLCEKWNYSIKSGKVWRENWRRITSPAALSFKAEPELCLVELSDPCLFAWLQPVPNMQSNPTPSIAPIFNGF